MNLREEINKFNENSYSVLLDRVSLEQKEECFNLIVEKLKEQKENPNLNIYIEKLPEDLRLKYIKLYQVMPFSFSKLIDGVSNEDILYQLLEYVLKGETLTFNIIQIFKQVPNKYKKQFLYLLSEREKELNQNIIESYNIDEYLLEFDIKTREEVLKDIIFENFKYEIKEDKQERFGKYTYSSILGCFVEPNQDMKDSSLYSVLLFFIDELNKTSIKNQEKERFSNIDQIFKCFFESGYNTNDIKEVLKLLLEKDLVENYLIPDINKKLPDYMRKEITSFIIEFYIQQNKKLPDYLFYELIENLNNANFIEFFDRYVIKEKKYDYSAAIKSNKNGLMYTTLLFTLMTDEEINDNFERIAEIFNTNENTFLYQVGSEKIIKVFSEKYDLNFNGLFKFVKKFSFDTLKYIQDEKIKKYINLSGDDLDKLLMLFDETNYYFNKSIKNDIVNSLYQREFMIRETDIYTVFNKFETLVFNGDRSGVIELLKNINNSFDINKILIKHNVSFEEFFYKTMNGELDILHEITNRYIALKREEYIKRKIDNVDEVLSMDRVISRDSYKKDLIMKTSYTLQKKLKKLDKSLLSNEQIFLIDNNNILEEIINFKKNPKEYELNPEYRKYLRTFSELLDILYENKIDFDMYNPNWEDNKKFEYDYIQKEIKTHYLLGILLESNYEGILNILNNKKLLDDLQEFLYKYKMIGWQDTFNSILENCDMVFNEGTIAGLLSNFDKINEKIESNITLTSIIDYCNCYSSVSKSYSILFERENFNLIVANSGRNKASMSKYERLSRNMMLINDMYNRQFITTPPINQTFAIGNDKSIGVVLGNSTNMMNLTYGERTNSCMRQGGAFDNLFHYSIQNENGFHIRFTNPRTGTFVSRVSGLRTGNTVFLNELRNSVDEEFTDDDLYIAIKQVSEYLISESKNSPVPIDNVIITSDFALTSKENQEQDVKLGSVDIRKKALREINFNYDDKGIVLATSTKQPTLVDYNFDLELPKYNVVRDEVKTYDGKSAIERIIQLKMINSLLNGKTIDNIDINESIDVDYIISGEDFYVAFKNEQIEVFVFDKSRQNERTKKEIEKIINSNSYVDENQKRGISL